jgi:hypothetical protein
MFTEIFFKAEVIKVATMAAKGGSIRLTLDVPLVEKTAILAMTQNKTAAVTLSLLQKDIDDAAGQLGLFEEDGEEK